MSRGNTWITLVNYTAQFGLHSRKGVGILFATATLFFKKQWLYLRNRNIF